MISPRRRLDRIEVTGIRAWGHHGVLAQETALGQTFSADVTLGLDTASAAAGDDLTRTVNYADVARAVQEELSGEPVALLETLADRIARRILQDVGHPLVRHLALRLHKSAAPVGLPVQDVTLSIEREAAPEEAVLALGTNLGDREEHLRAALEQLHAAEGIDIAWTSPVLRTAPVGGPADQGEFLNAVIGVRTLLGPWELLELAHRIEQAAQRERSIRWGPRTLDVDVITYGTWRSDDPELTIPHPHAHERAFVLGPWHAARPEDELPGHGPIGALLEQAADRADLAPGPEIEGFARP